MGLRIPCLVAPNPTLKRSLKMSTRPPGASETEKDKKIREKRENYQANEAKKIQQAQYKKDAQEEFRRGEIENEKLRQEVQAFQDSATRAQEQAKVEKSKWETVEALWEATTAVYNAQSAPGILGAHRQSVEVDHRFQPGDSRSQAILKPDPFDDGKSYPSIRRGFWTHGGFPLDKTFGEKSKNRLEPAQHSGSRRKHDGI